MTKLNFNYDEALRYSKYFAKKFFHNTIYYDDAVSHGLLETARAWEKFDPSRDIKFKTFLGKHLTLSMQNYWRSMNRNLERNIGVTSIDDVIESHLPSENDQINLDLQRCSRLVNQALIEFKMGENHKMRLDIIKVLYEKFYLEREQTETAKDMNLSRQRIKQLELQGLTYIKNHLNRVLGKRHANPFK